MTPDDAPPGPPATGPGPVAGLAGTRCAAHPSRPAADRCPVCSRPRCAADARGATGCRVCGGGPPRRRDPARVLVAVVRAGWAGNALVLLGAALGQEYVGAHIFSLVWPALVGMACGAVGVAALAGQRLSWLGRMLGAGFGVLSAAYAFHFADTPYGPPGRWLPPLAAAAGAAVALPGLLVGPARGRGRPAAPGPPG